MIPFHWIFVKNETVDIHQWMGLMSLSIFLNSGCMICLQPIIHHHQSCQYSLVRTNVNKKQPRIWSIFTSFCPIQFFEIGDQWCSLVCAVSHILRKLFKILIILNMFKKSHFVFFFTAKLCWAFDSIKIRIIPFLIPLTLFYVSLW